MEHLGWYAAAAPAEDMYPYPLYHSAPTQERDRIGAYGLMMTDPGINQNATKPGSKYFGPDPNAPDAPMPTGVYAFKDLGMATRYTGGSVGSQSDIWEIPANTISASAVSDAPQWGGDAVVINQDVPNINISVPYEQNPAFDQYENKMRGQTTTTPEYTEQQIMNDPQGPAAYYNLGNPDPVNQQKQYKLEPEEEWF